MISANPTVDLEAYKAFVYLVTSLRVTLPDRLAHTFYIRVQ